MMKSKQQEALDTLCRGKILIGEERKIIQDLIDGPKPALALTLYGEDGKLVVSYCTACDGHPTYKSKHCNDCGVRLIWQDNEQEITNTDGEMLREFHVSFVGYSRGGVDVMAFNNYDAYSKADSIMGVNLDRDDRDWEVFDSADDKNE